MSHFVKEFGIVDEDLETAIFNYIRKDKNPLTDSLLYSTISESKIYDKQKRLSQYKLFTDKKLFNMVTKLIDKINTIVDDYDYQLVKNDITYIKYEVGGFFKSHEDYLSATSNIFEEYTMIICMNEKECVGGHTIFTINDKIKIKSKSSITPKHCVLFRKDVVHEGEILKEGTKEIVTVNLLAYPKPSNCVIVVSFKDDDRKYHIFESNVKQFDNLLYEYVKKIKNSGYSDKIIYFDEHVFSYDSFKIIYDIFMKQHICLDDVKANKKIIKKYCIEYKNILTIDKSASNKLPFFNMHISDDILICDTKEKHIYVSNVNKSKLLPYIPFKIIFAEGTNVYGGGMQSTEPLKLKMTPIYVSFGECNNILFAMSVLSRDDFKFANDPNKMIEDIKKNYNFEIPPECSFSNKFIGFDFDRVEKNKLHNFYDGTDNTDNHSVHFVAGDDTCDKIYCGLTLCNDQLLDNLFKFDTYVEFGDFIVPENKKITKSTQYYHIDENNNIFLTKTKIKPVIDKIQESNFFNVIKKKLNDIPFVLPQKSHNFSGDFCNESVYGKFVFLEVNGFLKMS